MNRRFAKFAASLISLSILLLSPGGAAMEAAAQTYSASAASSRGGYSGSSASGAARFQKAPASFRFSAPGTGLGMKPSLSPAAAPRGGDTTLVVSPMTPSALEAATPEVGVAPAYSSVPGAEEAARTDLRGQAPSLTGSLGELTEVSREEAPAGGDAEASGWRRDRLFDGLEKRRGEASPSGSAVPARSPLGRAPVLGKPAPGSDSRRENPAPSPARPAPSRGVSKGLLAAGIVAVAVLFLMPAIALAAAPVSAAASVSWLLAAQPLASAGAAAAGAAYGLFAAHRDGNPSAGEALASVLRYGIIGGAGMYVLLDLSLVLFLGLPLAGLAPVPSAVATAALGQSAFQGKFTEPSTSPADRLMTAFPAVAAALGLSVGMFLAAQPALLAAAVGALSLTGVAAAVYSALYKPGKSAAEGPARMARGFVLQSLMTGIALAVADPLIAAPFMLLAAWGLWDVISTAGRELLAALPDWAVRSRKK